jgi:hypothetical protein
LASLVAYDEARKYLKNYVPRKARDSRFWLSGLLYCPNGHKLHGWNATTSRQPGLKYMCNVHRKKGKAACPHTYHVKHEEVAKLVIEYLEEISADLQGLSLSSLYQRKGKVQKRWRDLRNLVDRLLYDKLTTLFNYRQEGKVRVFEIPFSGWKPVRIPGNNHLHVEELLNLAVAAENAVSSPELDKLRERHGKIVASFPDATPGIRRELAKEAAQLETEIEKLFSGLGSLASELRRVFQEFTTLAFDVSRARRVLAGSDCKAMAEVANSILERVDCVFEVVSYPSGYEFSRLKGAKITPRLGSPEYRAVRQDGTPLRRCR